MTSASFVLSVIFILSISEQGKGCSETVEVFHVFLSKPVYDNTFLKLLHKWGAQVA